VISPYVVAAIGAREARRWFQTAEIFSAVEAERIGLLHMAVPVDALDAAVDRQCALLLKAGPIAVAEAKSLARRNDASQGADALDEANAELIARLRVSPEGQEGLGAFLDKRKPNWQEN
jgi:methylglutaconyl-CoA hydratase